jgi:hypothetical protein
MAGSATAGRVRTAVADDQTTRRNKHMDIKLNDKQRKIIDDGASQVPAGALGKYRKFIDDLIRGVRDPDDDIIRRAVWEASMRYADPR